MKHIFPLPYILMNIFPISDFDSLSFFYHYEVILVNPCVRDKKKWQDEPFSITLPFWWVIKHASRHKRSTLSLASFSYLICTAVVPHVLIWWWRCWIIDWSIFLMFIRIFPLAGVKQIGFQNFPCCNLASVIQPFRTIPISPAREVCGIGEKTSQQDNTCKMSIIRQIQLNLYNMIMQQNL